MSDSKPRSSLLVIDDELSAYETLEALLHSEDCELTYSPNATAALLVIEQTRFDAILCDVMMPDINGIELCRMLKSNPRYKHIPVIMVTALDSKQELSQCLAAGADDFLTKPVSGIELRARVRSMLRIKRQYDSLEESLRLREDLANMLVHDIKNPLTSILVGSEFLLNNSLDEPMHSFAQEISSSGRRINSMINDLLMLAKMESGRLTLNRTPVNLIELADTTTASFQTVAQTRRITLERESPSGTIPKIALDRNLMQRVLDNLISNSIKFSNTDGRVTIRVEPMPAPRKIRIQILDEGPGIAEDQRSRIFDKFEVGSLKKNVQQIGLGLAFCKLAVEAHGGQIYVTENKPNGSIFTVEI